MNENGQEERDWLFGLIREIKEMPSGMEAAVCLDTDDVHVLMIRDLAGEKYCMHFNIGWLEHDAQTVDWLARIIGRHIREAYEQGWRDKGMEIRQKLAGLKSLLI